MPDQDNMPDPDHFAAANEMLGGGDDEAKSPDYQAGYADGYAAARPLDPDTILIGGAEPLDLAPFAMLPGANIHGIGPDVGGGKNPLYRGPDMDFGQALDALKEGHRIARDGWNGADMFAYLVPAASYPVQTGAAIAHFGEGALVPYRAYLALKTAQGDVATWVPSVSDVLATDWFSLDFDVADDTVPL